MTVKVIKDGTVKLTIPATITDGFPNFQGKFLVSKAACEAAGVDPKSLIQKRPTPSTGKYYLRMGMNPDGNNLVDADEESLAQQEAVEKTIYALHSGSPKTGDNRKWGACEKCNVTLPPGYGKLRFCAMDTGCLEHHDRDGWHLRCVDETACAARVPAARRAAQIASLRDQAEHEKHVALGALTYDADGWLSRDDQQKRHDEGMTKSAALQAQADALSKE